MKGHRGSSQQQRLPSQPPLLMPSSLNARSACQHQACCLQSQCKQAESLLDGRLLLCAPCTQGAQQRTVSTWHVHKLLGAGTWECNCLTPDACEFGTQTRSLTGHTSLPNWSICIRLPHHSAKLHSRSSGPAICACQSHYSSSDGCQASPKCHLLCCSMLTSWRL